MRAYFAAFVVSAIVAWALTPLVRRMALRFGAVARLGARHVHNEVKPRLGGLAIVGAFLTPLLALFFVDSSVAASFRAESVKAAALLGGGLALAVVGVVDDTRGLRAGHKLLAQVVVAIAAFAAGLRIDIIGLPWVGNIPMGIFSFPITLLWIVGIVNAVNLIDGLDGLAAGVVFFACITNFVVAYLSHSVIIAVVMAAMIGALAGFLIFNFNPARIFMGDSGSYFLGYSIATVVLVGSQAQKTSAAVSLLVPCVALGVPIFDTLFTMVRRFLERRPLFSPDRGHIHHRLIDMGLTHRRAVLSIYAVSVVFSVAAIAISIGNNWQIGLAILVASLVFFMLVRFAGYFEYLQANLRSRTRARAPHVEALRRALPPTLTAIARAESESDVLAALEAFGPSAKLCSVRLASRRADGPLFEWGSFEDPDRIAIVLAVGDARARVDVEFCWLPGDGHTSPEAEALLQVLVDVLAAELGRLRSSLAPKAPHTVDSAPPVPSGVLQHR